MRIRTFARALKRYATLDVLCQCGGSAYSDIKRPDALRLVLLLDVSDAAFDTADSEYTRFIHNRETFAQR